MKGKMHYFAAILANLQAVGYKLLLLLWQFKNCIYTCIYVAEKAWSNKKTFNKQIATSIATGANTNVEFVE